MVQEVQQSTSFQKKGYSIEKNLFCLQLKMAVYWPLFVLYIYINAIMKTICPPGYHHGGFVVTHALGQMMYGCHKAYVVITGNRGSTLQHWTAYIYTTPLRCTIMLFIFLCRKNIFSNSDILCPNYNHGHKILIIFDVLPNFPFTTSKMKPDY